jgi:hypothetical protein
MLPPGEAACQGGPRDAIHSGTKAVGATVNVMSGPKVDLAALAPRDERSAPEAAALWCPWFTY